MRFDSKVFGRVAEQPTPSATDIQHRLARGQPQLSTDHFHLVELSLLERIVRMRKVPARILHFLVEKQLVKIVTNIVVKLDIVLVVPLRFGASYLIRLKNCLVFGLLFAVGFCKQEWDRISQQKPFA